MDKFAETAIVDTIYRLQQRKTNSISHFNLQQTNGSLPFPFAANKREIAVFP
jgi:hypothetical protein